jgi:hypothetical protein
LQGSRNGTDEGGDGTVPRVSATPRELWGDQTEIYAAECHGSLQNGDDVLRQVEGLLSGLSIYKQPLRGLQGAQIAQRPSCIPQTSRCKFEQDQITRPRYSLLP